MNANKEEYREDEEKLASAGLIVPNMPRPRFLLHATIDDELYSILGRLVTSETLRKIIKSADPGLYAEMKSLLDERRRAYNIEMTANRNQRDATCSGGDEMDLLGSQRSGPSRKDE